MKRIIAAALTLAAATFPVGSARADDDGALLKEGREATKICLTCHHFTKPKRKFGPHLVDLLARPVASVNTYAYSDALRALGGEWTEDRLAAFLNDPARFAPGTNMKFAGYKNARTAEAAVAYIKRRFNR